MYAVEDYSTLSYFGGGHVQKIAVMQRRRGCDEPHLAIPGASTECHRQSISSVENKVLHLLMSGIQSEVGSLSCETGANHFAESQG